MRSADSCQLLHARAYAYGTTCACARVGAIPQLGAHSADCLTDPAPPATPDRSSFSLSFPASMTRPPQAASSVSSPPPPFLALPPPPRSLPSWPGAVRCVPTREESHARHGRLSRRSPPLCRAAPGPLLTALHRARLDACFYAGVDFVLLGRVVATLGVYVECASNAPSTRVAAASLVPILRHASLRYHQQPFVRRCPAPPPRGSDMASACVCFKIEGRQHRRA